jgi:TatD DNase family protein
MADTNPSPTVQTPAVDSHCHLFLLDEPAQTAVRAAREAGVGPIVCVGIDPDSSRRSLELADSLRGVFATAGMHPHTASELDHRARAEIEELLANRHVVGVGETGLDFFRMLSPREEQVRALRLHVALSRETGKPLVVHVRDAWPEILRVLDEGSPEVVLHCFSGDATIARECAARGYHLSFAGNVTYPKNAHLREAAAAAPLERLLVETDSPFLSPQRHRGRPNSPANVVEVIEAVAAARKTEPDAVARATSANAMRVFRGIG